MNKTELIDALTSRLGDRKAASEAVDHFVEVIQRALAGGDRVSITGFGVFDTAKRPARTARNPFTGETIRLKKSTVAKFRPGARLKAIVNGEIKLARLPSVSVTVSRISGAGIGAAKKAPAKKAPAKKAPAKKAPAKKAPAKKAPAKKA